MAPDNSRADRSKSLSELRFSTPGKTFLIGEYLILKGGPAILAATAPRFELLARRLSPVASDDGAISLASLQATDLATSHSAADVVTPTSPGAAGSNVQMAELFSRRVQGIALQSPAGKLWQQYHQSLEGWTIEFLDPHAGQGGLGASSAQFVMMLALLAQVAPQVLPGLSQTSFNVVVKGASLEQVLGIYKSVAWDGTGEPPSGADVVCHLLGEMTSFSKLDGQRSEESEASVGLSQGASERLLSGTQAWPFAELDFTLVRTGKKLATHEHLRGELHIPTVALKPLAEEALRALQVADQQRLIVAVQEYGRCLKAHGLLAEYSAQLVSEISRLDGIFAAKGCGAMGADIILVLHNVQATQSLHRWCRERGLKVAGSRQDLSGGIALRAE